MLTHQEDAPATIAQLTDELELPAELVQQLRNIRQHRLTGSLEIDARDGRLRSLRWIPPRTRFSDRWEASDDPGAGD